MRTLDKTVAAELTKIRKARAIAADQDRLRVAIRDAQGVGMSMTDIADKLGITRQACYKALS